MVNSGVDVGKKCLLKDINVLHIPAIHALKLCMESFMALYSSGEKESFSTGKGLDCDGYILSC